MTTPGESYWKKRALKAEKAFLWKKIKTAPHDGTRILCLDTLGTQMVVHYNPHKSTGNQWQVENLSAWFGEVSDETGGVGISHWRPLSIPDNLEQE